jgi:hypothetical protein
MAKLRLRERIVRLLLPDYGHSPNTPTAPGGLTDVAEELPRQRNANAAMAADYEDHVATLDIDAHPNARKCLPVQIGVSKLAGNIATVNWEVRGGNAARAEWLHKRFEGFYAWAALVENYVWSMLEGARYHQMKPAPARGDMFIGFDFEHGAAYKEKAGGTIHNDGVNLFEITRPGLEGLRQTRVLPRRDWIELRPGLTRNPEGDSTLGMSLVPLVQAWHDGMYRAKQSAKAAGFPVTLIEHSLSNRRPGSMAGAMAVNANAMRSAQATPGSVLSMSDEAKARILEPTPGMMRDVWEHLINIAGMVYQALLHNSLTTQTTDSGPTGSSYVHLGEEQTAVLVAAIRFIEMFNRQAVPRLFEWNAGFDVPPLNEDEEECYFWPAPVEVASPMNDGEDGTGDIEDADDEPGSNGNGESNGNGKPENGRNRIKEFV